MGRHFHCNAALRRTDELALGKYPKPPAKNSRWYIHPTWPGQHKKGQRVYLGFAREVTKREAEKARQGVLSRINRTPVTIPSQTLFCDFVATYEAEYLARRAPSTQVHYHCVIQKYLVPRFGDVALGEITRLDVQRWTSALTVTRNRKVGILAVLSSIMDRAADWDYYDKRNPAKRIELGAEEIRSDDLAALTPDQVAAQLAELPDPLDTLVAVMFFAGLRCCEVLGLTPAALRGQALYVFQVVDTPTRRVRKVTKNKKANLVPCPGALMSKLVALAGGKGPTDLLFGGIRYGKVYWWIKRAEKRLGFKLYRSGTHTARRTFATTFNQVTGELPTANLGHSSAEMTTQYVRPTADAQAMKAEVLWQAVYGQAGGVQ